MIKLLKTFLILTMSAVLPTSGDDESLDFTMSSKCITAEKVLKPLRNWEPLSIAPRFDGGVQFLIVKAHNPVYTNPLSVDVELLFRADPNAPLEPTKGTLLVAIYRNLKTTVIFKRIVITRENKGKKKVEKIHLPTPCFSREVEQNINVEIGDAAPPNNDGGATDNSRN